MCPFVVTARLEITMHTPLHAVGWALPRLAIVVGLSLFAIVLAYAVLVFFIVAVQAVGAFGQ
jgi:hypothetical protein